MFHNASMFFIGAGEKLSFIENQNHNKILNQIT